jgi:hypothetical protein
VGILSLPLDVLRLVYALDPTYRHVYNLCLLELEVLFGEHRFPRRVLSKAEGCVWSVERVLWAMAGDVPVVLSWTRARESLRSRHSDMPVCGCTKCSHSRPTPRPQRGPRRDLSPKPKPKASGKKKRYGRSGVRWVGVWHQALALAASNLGTGPPGPTERAKAPPGQPKAQGEGGFTSPRARAKPQVDGFKAHHTFVAWVSNEQQPCSGSR